MILSMRSGFEKSYSYSNLKSRNKSSYLTTALTYGELEFPCAFGEESIEVTEKKKRRNLR